MAETSNQRGANKKGHKTRVFVNLSAHKIRKREPLKPDRRDSVIYVGNQSNIQALLAKCDKLIKNDEQEIYIYCMGAAIQRGILLALQLCEQHVAFRFSVNTSTVNLVDDLEPTTDDANFDIINRSNSGLQIKVFRPPAAPADPN